MMFMYKFEALEARSTNAVNIVVNRDTTPSQQFTPAPRESQTGSMSKATYLS